ncbi:MAG: sugar ABC transporter permease, partial [Halorhabdus sp.]
SVMNTIYAFFGTFAFVDVLTGGGPNGGTSIMIYSLYRNAFDGSRHGLASAESVVLFVIVSLLMLIQLHYSDRHAHYGG